MNLQILPKYRPLILFILIILLTYLSLFILSLLNPSLKVLKYFFGILASYDLNAIILGIFALILALITFCNEISKRHDEKVDNQIALLDSLLAELETISSDKSEIYGGDDSKGNLQWYLENINSKNENKLDHDINSISYSSYITKLNKNILNLLNFKKLVRTLSYINDKIMQINTHTKKLLLSKATKYNI